MPSPPRRLVSQARSLRQDATDAERRLWSRLKNGQLAGWQFRRQHPIPPYIVDFACIAARLIVEADGGQHWESARDARRDAYLAGKGWYVLRFWNQEILTNTDGVIEAILYELRHGPLPTLPRKAGEGPSGSALNTRLPATHLPDRTEIAAATLAPPPPLAGEGRGGGRGE